LRAERRLTSFAIEMSVRRPQQLDPMTLHAAQYSDVEALIFDFDGVIIDSERVEADCIIEIVAETPSHT
jgi:hypothetical protein